MGLGKFFESVFGGALAAGRASRGDGNLRIYL